MSHLTPYAELGGAGAAGGLGAALASLGATLAPGASAVLNAVDFDTRVAGSDLVVTGEGRVDATSLEGKVPASVAAACEALKIPCVVFGGQIDAAGKGLYARGATALFALSGQPQEAVEDLERLGYGLARLAAGLRRG
jgi:glycerate kinase